MKQSDKFWDKVSVRFEEPNQKYAATAHKVIENTQKYLSQEQTVLDFACGTGRFSRPLAGFVREIVAIDTSSSMIDIAKEKAKEHKIENITFMQSSLFDERYANESFNVVLAFNVLHLIEDTQKVLQRINQLLKPGGIFISSTPCMAEKKSFKNFIFFLRSQFGKFPYIKKMKCSDLESRLTEEKFKIIDSNKLDYNPPHYFITTKK